MSNDGLGAGLCVSPGVSFCDGSWHHLALTWRGNDGQVSQPTAALTQPMTSLRTTRHFGCPVIHP